MASKTFTRLHTIETYTNKERTVKVKIAKFQKDGTKQVFFAPEYNGKRFVKTLFARKYDAVSVAKEFIKYKENKLAAA